MKQAPISDADISLLVSHLRQEYEEHKIDGTEQQSKLVRLIDFVRERSKNYSPRYSNITPFLHSIASEYRLKFFGDRFEVVGPEVLEERCKEVSVFLSEAARNRGSNFMKALLKCMWNFNHELVFFPEPPEPRAERTSEQWLEYAKALLEKTLTNSADDVAKIRVNYSSNFEKERQFDPIIYIQYKFSDRNNVDAFLKIECDLFDLGYKSQIQSIGKTGGELIIDNLKQKINDTEAVILLFCPLMSKLLSGDTKLSNSLRELLQGARLGVVITVDDARSPKATESLFPSEIMRTHLEYPKRGIVESISRLIHTNKIDGSRRHSQVQKQNRKHEGLLHISEKLNPALMLQDAQELHFFIFDIDGMGRLNRVYGDEVGDLVCECVFDFVRRVAEGKNGVAGQSGDDSFFMYIHGPADMELAQEVISGIKGFGWETICAGLWVTVSCGYSFRSIVGSEAGIDVALRAIFGLRSAKRNGGDQVALGPQKLVHSNSDFRKLCESRGGS